MAEAKLADSFGDIGGLMGIERAGLAGGDVAEGAGARADVAHDHEGGVLVLPAFADVGAGRLLAHRDETVLAHQPPGLGVFRRIGRTHPDPIRLAPDRIVRPVRLLGMALGAAERDLVDRTVHSGPRYGACARRLPVPPRASFPTAWDAGKPWR